MATENATRRESQPEEEEKQTRVYTQLTETERVRGQNGFEFANDEITEAARKMDDPPRAPTQLPQSAPGAKYPWPENGFSRKYKRDLGESVFYRVAFAAG